MRRAGPIAAVAMLLVMTAAGVRAEVIHGETSQQAFGFNEVGVAIDGVEGNQEFVQAWEKFSGSVEGARILGKLDGSREFEITIEVKPGAEFDGEDVYGRSVLFTHPNDEGQTRVGITINEDDPGGVDQIAETIYHEMRHVELWLDGDFSTDDEDGHDRLHADTDDGIVRFKEQIGLRPVDSGEVPATSTPISDAIRQAADEERMTSFLAIDLGEVLGIRPETDVSFDPSTIEITEFVAVPEVDPATQASIDAIIGGLEVTGECAPSRSAAATTVCGDGSAASPGGVLVGMQVGTALDPDAFVGSVSVFAGFESDGDPTNNRPGAGPEDPYRGLDRWYEMILDDGAIDLNAWQVGPDDSTPELDQATGAIGVLQDDTAWFLIPRDELPTSDPRVRLAMLNFEGNPITGINALDVSGELPSDPPIALDGSRAGGQVTGYGAIDDGTVRSFGPTIAPAGGVLDAEFCVADGGGSPRADLEVFATLGDPPDGETATHNNGTTDESGCARLPLEVQEPAGTSSLFFSVGLDAVRLGPIFVRDDPPSPPVSVSGSDDQAPDMSATRFLEDLFVGVDLEARGEVHHFEDEPDDLVNPFFGSAVDPLDTTLPEGWNILWGDYFMVDSAVAPSVGDDLVQIEPGQETGVNPAGYTFYGRYAMAEDVEDRTPLGTHWCTVSVGARQPDRPTTLPASVIDASDPIGEANVWWTAWFGPNGEMFSTKTEVHPETRVPQNAEEHSTLAVVDGNEVILMIPGDEIAGADRVAMWSACSPLEYTDYGLHIRDTVVEADVPPTFFDPAWVSAGMDEPMVEDTVRDAVTDTLASTTTTSTTSPARSENAAEPSSDAGLPTVVSLLVMAFGLAMVGAGIWAFRRAGSPR